MRTAAIAAKYLAISVLLNARMSGINRHAPNGCHVMTTDFSYLGSNSTRSKKERAGMPQKMADGLTSMPIERDGNRNALLHDGEAGTTANRTHRVPASGADRRVSRASTLALH